MTEHHTTAAGAGAGEEFWDARYRESDRIWSGDPNAALVAEVTDLPPGRALDLGCGEGGDAIWLALRGWHVTATDISGVALERAALHARDAGVPEGAVEWQRHDLAESFPEGAFDLVSASYLHTPGDMPREAILRRAAAAVVPGGVLLVTGHADPGPFDPPAHHDMHFPTPRDVLASLELPSDTWQVERAEAFERTQKGPDGRPGLRNDNVLRVRRPAA